MNDPFDEFMEEIDPEGKLKSVVSGDKDKEKETLNEMEQQLHMQSGGRICLSCGGRSRSAKCPFCGL